MRKSILTKQTKKFKEVRKIRKRLNEIGYTDLYSWIPVEKPEFIGWDTIVGLSELALRRPDANNLIKVLGVLKISEPKFTKDTFIIKLIRSSNKRYSTINSKYNEYLRTKKQNGYSNCIPGINNYQEHSLTVEKFNLIDENLKQYFYRDDKHYPKTAWKDAYIYTKYKISPFNFPIRELVVRDKKAYSTHKGIPKYQEISESEKLTQKLYNTDLRCYTYSNSSPNKWYRKYSQRKKRMLWHTHLHNLRNKEIKSVNAIDNQLYYNEKHTINKLSKDMYW